MKRNDSGAFSIFYLEADDTREALFTSLAGLQKPVVLFLSEQARIFQHPEEFMVLRHLRRQLDIAIYFIIAHSDHLVALTERCGFPVYKSIDALSEALQPGNASRQRVLVRTDGNAPHPRSASPVSPRRTVPLHLHDDISLDNTAQLPALAPIARPITPKLPAQSTGTIPFPARDDVSKAMPRARPHQASTGNIPLQEQKGIKNHSVITPSLSSHASFIQETPPIAVENGVRMTGPLTPHPMPTAPYQTGRMRTTDPLASHSMPARMGGEASVPRQYASGKVSASATIDELPTRPPIAGPKVSKRHNRIPAVLISLMILALSSAGLASLLVFYHPPTTLSSTPAAPPVIGHVYFLSSGQFNEQTNQGLNDELQIQLTHLAMPTAGRRYYAWLLGDEQTEDMKVIPLGALNVNNGDASLFYADPTHTNLLAITSRFLVTEENSTPPPIAPSPDPSRWRYYGAFLQKPVPFTGSMPGMSSGTLQYSYLDHLRHLLADEPMLDANELPGGLNIWLYQNTGKILAWTTSMRSAWVDQHDMNAVSSQALLTLTYLDGLSYIARDLPTGVTPSVTDRQARIGLLDIDGPNQDPPDYLDSIVAHLNGLLQAGGSTPALRQQVGALIDALNDVRYRLQKVRADALHIVKMNAQQLAQPTTLDSLNDMVANATDAYTGWFDPTTGKQQPGVTWIYSHIQALATIAVTPYNASSSQIQHVRNREAIR